MGMYAATLRAQIKDMWLHMSLAQKLAVLWFFFLAAMIVLLGVMVDVSILAVGGIIGAVVISIVALVNLIN